MSNGRLDLVGVAERMRRVGVKGVETSVWYGSPVKGIVDPARFRKPELIVMSTHGRSRLSRLVLDSVAESVLRTTSTPILLLRSDLHAWTLGPVHDSTACDGNSASGSRSRDTDVKESSCFEH